MSVSWWWHCTLVLEDFPLEKPSRENTGTLFIISQHELWIYNYLKITCLILKINKWKSDPRFKISLAYNHIYDFLIFSNKNKNNLFSAKYVHIWPIQIAFLPYLPHIPQQLMLILIASSAIKCYSTTEVLFTKYSIINFHIHQILHEILLRAIIQIALYMHIYWLNLWTYWFLLVLSWFHIFRIIWRQKTQYIFFYIAFFWRPRRKDWITTIVENLFLETSTGFFNSSGKKHFHYWTKYMLTVGYNILVMKILIFKTM